MILPLLLAATAAFASPAASGRIVAPPPRAAWLLCDGVDGDRAALIGAPGADGRSAVTWLDRRARRQRTLWVGVGRDDPGAGQVYNALLRDGRAVGQIHRVNPGMVDDPPLPPVIGVTLDGARIDCRFMPGTLLLGIAPTRSVTVRRAGGRLIYESFDVAHPGAPRAPDGVHRGAVPTLRIVGGVALPGGVYRFVNAGVTYTVAATGGDGAGLVRATRGAQRLAENRFLGVQAAR